MHPYLDAAGRRDTLRGLAALAQACSRLSSMSFAGSLLAACGGPLQQAALMPSTDTPAHIGDKSPSRTKQSSPAIAVPNSGSLEHALASLLQGLGMSVQAGKACSA